MIYELARPYNRAFFIKKCHFTRRVKSNDSAAFEHGRRAGNIITECGVLLTIVLTRFRNAKGYKIFIIAFLVGTAAEYICSLGQEIVFGSVAWDYSSLPLNINGRVCLLYSLFWGFLGIFWVKCVMPLTDKLFCKIPQSLNRVLAWVFVVFFVFDAVLSATAALRMKEREIGKAPSNVVEVYLDKHFPDERMHSIYANSREVN